MGGRAAGLPHFTGRGRKLSIGITADRASSSTSCQVGGALPRTPGFLGGMARIKEAEKHIFGYVRVTLPNLA